LRDISLLAHQVLKLYEYFSKVKGTIVVQKHKKTKISRKKKDLELGSLLLFLFYLFFI